MAISTFNDAEDMTMGIEKKQVYLPLIAVGNDTLIPLVIYRKGGEPSLDPPEAQDRLVRPESLEELTIKICNRDCGHKFEPTSVSFRGGQIVVELSGEQTKEHGIGIYQVDLTYNATDPNYSDGKRLVHLSRQLCRVVKASDETLTAPKEVTLEVAEGLKGEKGDKGDDAYETAVNKGLVSTLEQWVELTRGVPGKSAYQEYLDTTNDQPKKSREEWLASLAGQDGKSVYDLAVEAGYEGSKESYLASLKGDAGDDAYALARKEGYQGSLREWLASLKGDDGDSAYKVAVRLGYNKSEQEWLASLAGQAGKSAYQIYLDTTTDDPKLTEEQWAKVNDYHYAIIHRYLYGKDAPMSNNKLMGDELVALHQYIKDTADALASVGVKVSESDGIASFPQKIRDYIPPTLLIFRSQQLSGYKQEWFPLLRVDPNYTQADLSYTFYNNAALTRVPVVDGLERAVSLASLFNGCSSLRGEFRLPSLPRCTSVANMCVGCVMLDKVSIGDMDLLEDAGSLASGCSSLTELTIGAIPKLKKSFSMCINCTSLRLVRFSSGSFSCAGDMSYMFSGCSLLQRIDGVLEISSVSNVTNIFAGCYELSDVKVKLSASKLDLSSCYKLSAESLRYLIDNATATRGGVITLSSQLSSRDELRETLEYVGAKAVDKGFSVVYR